MKNIDIVLIHAWKLLRVLAEEQFIDAPQFWQAVEILKEFEKEEREKQ